MRLDDRQQSPTTTATSAPRVNTRREAALADKAGSVAKPPQDTPLLSNDARASLKDAPVPSQSASASSQDTPASSKNALPPTEGTPSVSEVVSESPAKKIRAHKAKETQKRALSPDWPSSPFGVSYDSELLERVQALTTLSDTASNRFGLTKIPKGTAWGAEEHGLDDTLCYDGRPVIALVIGEIDNASFYNEIGQPLKFVRLAVRPLYHADLVTAHRIIRQLAANLKKEDDLEIGIVEAGRRQSRREKKGRNTVAYEFKHAYDATEQYGPKSIMPKIGAQELGYRDLVVMECKIVRFRVNSETGKASYSAKSWASWRVRFDIMCVCRLNESEEEAESVEATDDESVPVI